MARSLSAEKMLERSLKTERRSPRIRCCTHSHPSREGSAAAVIVKARGRFSSSRLTTSHNSKHIMDAQQMVSCFGKKKNATAVANAKEGKGIIRVNGQPLNLITPETLRWKVYEPVLVVGQDKFAPVDIRVRVSGGGHTSQVYAIRQAIAKSLVAYYAKYYDAASALELRQTLIAYDRTLLISDPRRMEPKKFGGRGARARRQKSYR
ncbi:hypothetical protein CF335_g2855 [Tilletia laevis]|nr:hypothetical protein CF335_g2855 [Tilletia laevis]